MTESWSAGTRATTTSASRTARITTPSSSGRGLPWPRWSPAGQHIVAVTHGGIVKATMKDVCRDADLDLIRRVPTANCAVTEVEVHGSSREIRARSNAGPPATTSPSDRRAHRTPNLGLESRPGPSRTPVTSPVRHSPVRNGSEWFVSRTPTPSTSGSPRDPAPRRRRRAAPGRPPAADPSGCDALGREPEHRRATRMPRSPNGASWRRGPAAAPS